MPLFDYACTNEECTEVAKLVELIKPYEAKVLCEKCQSQMTKKFTLPDRKFIAPVSWSSWKIGLGSA